MRLDPLDVKIVGLLQADARLSFREIAERLGSTTPTVSARVRALEDIGLIRGYHAQLDHAVLGASNHVLILTVEPQRAKDALLAAQHLPGLHGAHLLAGGRLVALVHLRPPTQGLRQLHEAIVAIPGLVTYEASEVIDGLAHAGIADLPESVDVPCHQCRGPIHGDPVKGRFGERMHVFCCRHCLASFRGRHEAMAAAAAKSAHRGARFHVKGA
ncbi:MAG TPA: AsnC family transcriptional regulator [Candidatus Thermoplasmatota archaeon]|nr:AsnC family transcriptional regulator [Candidatus Thermoplasmatota archaeon]